MSNEVSIYDAEPVNKWLANTAIIDRMNHALGGFMNGEDFIAQIMIAFQDEKLAKCSAKSKFEAAHKCASLCLLPTLQQVALIPRKVWQNRQHVDTVVDVMPQWQGYKSMMERHHDVQEVKAVLVHKNDGFAFDAITETIAHQVFPFDPNRTISGPDDIHGGYVRVTYRDRTRPPTYHFVPVAYIVKCRDCSQSYRYEQKDLREWEHNGKKCDKPEPSVWTLWFEQQAIKTCYRSAYYRRVVNFDPVLMRRLQVLAELDQEVLAEDPKLVGVPIGQMPALPAPAPVTTQSRAQILAGTVSGAAAPARTPVQQPPTADPPAPTTTAALADASSGHPTADAAEQGNKPEPPASTEAADKQPELSDEEQKKQLFRTKTERKFLTCKGQAEREKIFDELCGMDLSDETRELVGQWNQAAKDRLNAAKKASGQKQLVV